MEITIQKLTPDRLNDYLHFFDNVAFTDNPRWATCYCYYNLANVSNEEWMKRTGEQNREAAAAAILAGEMQGFLAYEDGLPVGWCHANAKDTFGGFAHTPSSPGRTASIVCFIIAPAHRRKGIAGKLLAAVCEHSKSEGYQYIEGYPRVNGETEAENYHGPLQMYEKNGFEQVAEISGLLAMRKQLA